MSHPTSATTASQRRQLVDPTAFIQYLRAQCDVGASTGRETVCMMIELHRSDRLSALLADPHSQRVQRAILDCVAGALRPHDRCVAVAQDEIWIVLAGLAHIDLAMLAANRILNDLDEFNRSGQFRTTVHPSIGLASVPLHAPGVARLLEACDRARRLAATSEDRIVVYNASHSIAAHDPELEVELREATRQNTIGVNFQPQIDFRTGECVAAETLLRYRRGGKVPVSPAVLIDIAERTDIIHPLTMTTLATGFRHWSELRRAGWMGGLSFNMSGRLAGMDDFPDQVVALLETWDIPPSSLMLEITETALVTDADRAIAMLKRLKDAGIGLSMDDFGTGYSSLAQFRNLPLDEIKIDKLFVQGMLTNVGDAQIVRAMIDLGHNFGLKVVAEGIEDRDTFERLRDLGCDLAQGYLFSPGVTPQDFHARFAAPGAPNPLEVMLAAAR